MSKRLSLSLALVPVVALLAGGCDQLLDQLRVDGVRPGGGAGGGGAPAPVPPPVADAGPAPSGPACASSADCNAPTTCSVERGVCNVPPGCDRPGVACPAVCYGTCELVDKPGAPLPPTPRVPPSPACGDIVLAGDETTCKTQGEWKRWAYETCQASGQTLGDYGVGGGDCGMGGHRMVKYQCCKPAPIPPGPVPPVPTPPPGRCEGFSDGGPTSCKSPEIWKRYASDDCSGRGMSLTDIGYSEECGGGNYRYMKYLCCAAVAR